MICSLMFRCAPGLHPIGFFASFFTDLLAMLPDRIGRADHRKPRQQQNLREAEAIQTTLGEALDKGLGADRAIH